MCFIFIHLYCCFSFIHSSKKRLRFTTFVFWWQTLYHMSLNNPKYPHQIRAIHVRRKKDKITPFLNKRRRRKMFVGGVLYQGRYSTKKFGWGSITKKFGWKPVTKTFSWKSKLSQNHYNVVIKNNTKVVKFSAFFLVLFKNNIHQKKWPEASLIKKKVFKQTFSAFFLLHAKRKKGWVCSCNILGDIWSNNIQGKHLYKNCSSIPCSKRKKMLLDVSKCAIEVLIK